MNCDVTEVPALSVGYKCKFCGKSFVKESTLTSHLCEKKRRAQQEKEIGVQWGFLVYKLFYEITQATTKSRTYQDFSESAYYTAFVKFGRYCVDLKCINYESYARWLLKNNKKIDQWTSDKFYDEWLLAYLRKETAQDALLRGMEVMQEYAESNDLKNGYKDYFRYGNANRICHHISTGRISPWVIYNCTTGIDFLDQLDESHVKIIIDWIDPAFWKARFKDDENDTTWAKMILDKAGL